MSDMTAPAHAHRVPHKPATARRRAAAVLAAEWIKLRSLRSMLVTALLTAVLCLVQVVSVCSNWVSQWSQFDPATRAAFDPLDTNIQFVLVAAIFFGVIGALVVTNEYRSGLIRTTLAATPQRGLVLAAKALLVGLLGFALAAVICFTAFFAGQAIFSGRIPHVSLGDPGVFGHVLGAVYYLTAIGLIGLFIGAVARNAAGAISSVFALMLVLPILLDKLPADAVTRHTVPYLPFNLGYSLWHSPASGHVGALAAVVGLAAWVVVLAAVAAAALRGRDA